MSSQRRQFIRAVGAVAAGGFAGCTSLLSEESAPNQDSPASTSTPTEGTPSSTSAPTTTVTSNPSETATSKTPPSSGPDLTTESAKLLADDRDQDDRFGDAIAVSRDGQTLLIGATEDKAPSGDSTGSVYVFTRSDSEWTQAAKLLPGDEGSKYQFGWAVAVAADGERAFVGAPGDADADINRPGSVYLFERAGGNWDKQARLQAGDGDRDDRFGSAVSASGDGATVLVGAQQDEDPNGNYAGSAYVFQATDGTWSDQTKLASTDRGGAFGITVALSTDGTTALVGAPGNENANGETAGAVYVFGEADGTWTQQTKIILEDGSKEDIFGDVLSLAGDGSTVLVGAPATDPKGNDSGAAYLFSEADGTWAQQTTLTAGDGDADDGFGNAVAIAGDGSTAIIGADDDEDPHGPGEGSAYRFTHDSSSWIQQAKLAPTEGGDKSSTTEFGHVVALANDGDTGFVGAPGALDNISRESGAVYLYD